MDRADTIERARTRQADAYSYDSSASWTEEQPSLPGMQPPPIPRATAAPSVLVRPKRRFAGFTYGQLLAGMLILAATIWGMWATSKIFALDDRRVVSVRLAAIVNDFVTSEARSGTPPEQLAARTKAFMLALDTVLKARAAEGQVVLVGEAVVASSVPDVTTEVVSDLSKIAKLAAPAEIPPGITPIMPLAPSAPAAAPAPPPSADPQGYGSIPSGSPLDPMSSPFGSTPQPAQTVPQQ